MSTEDSRIPDTESKKPMEEPDQSSGERVALVETARTGRKSPADTGRFCRLLRPIFVISGVGLCIGLCACVDTYGTYGSGYTSTTTYRPGYRVSSLPGGYRSELISGSTYYYHDGHYYQPSSSGYVVVSAPRNSRYYEDYGRRHQSVQSYRRPDGYSSGRHDQRYERTEVITSLPDGYRVVNRHGNTYYQAGDRYYQRQGNGYLTVSRPY